MLTRDQRYAQAIYEQIQATKYAQDSDNAKKYGSLAHKLPILIRKAGLMQTLAFVEARHKPQDTKNIQADSPQYQLITHLAVTLKFSDASAFLQAVRQAELGAYMRYTQQALDALLWYKRFAESVLGVSTTDEAGEQGGDKTNVGS